MTLQLSVEKDKQCKTFNIYTSIFSKNCILYLVTHILSLPFYGRTNLRILQLCSVDLHNKSVKKSKKAKIDSFTNTYTENKINNTASP